MIKKTDLITFYGSPDIKLHSEYGFITFLEWCIKEVARINKANKNVVIHTNEVGSIAIVKGRASC